MKNITKTLIAFLGILVISCSTNDVEDRPIIQGVNSPVLTAPLSSAAYTLSPANATSQIERFVWTSANYNGAVVINYELQIDVLGGDFSAPKVLGGANNANQASVSVETLNGAALDLGALPYTNTSFDVRVISSASGFDKMASNKITIVVNPYTTALPKLGVPGNHMGWTLPTTAALMPQLASSGYGKTNYEGYMTLNGDFKFLTPLTNGDYNWGPANWGDDGSFGGVLLSNSGTNANIAAGYYLVKANTATTGTGALQYSADPITWSVTGSATPLGWPAGSGVAGQDHDMTYNATTKKWTVTLALTGGQELKFRANDAWTINLGKFNPLKIGNDYGGETMSYSGDNIPVATSGTYTITLDLSNPRDYKYSIN
jgi:hypothetical protein